jgi:hypothetical protein
MPAFPRKAPLACLSLRPFMAMGESLNCSSRVERVLVCTADRKLAELRHRPKIAFDAGLRRAAD